MATKARANKPAAKKAATKKAATKKAATKKAATKKAAAKTQEVVKYTAKDVVLTRAQETHLRVIANNQDKILKAAHNMMDLAFNSGQRLLRLKEEVQNKYGRVWKEWAEANLGIGYPQASRYMKLAANPDQYALLDDSVTSIEGAVKQIEHLKNPEKAKEKEAARKARNASKSASGNEVPVATGYISDATVEEIQRCTDVQELRDLITVIHGRIDELQDGDVIDGEAEEIDDDGTEDAEEHVAAIS